MSLPIVYVFVTVGALLPFKGKEKANSNGRWEEECEQQQKLFNNTQSPVYLKLKDKGERSSLITPPDRPHMHSLMLSHQNSDSQHVKDAVCSSETCKHCW
jgi:hypothetical protein